MKTAQRLTLLLMMAPAILWLGVLIVLPHVEILILSFSERVAPRVYQFGFGNYLEFFTEPLYWRTFARTAIMSILVTAVTLVLAFPIALYIARVAQGRVKAMLLLLCLLPFWVSELVRTLGWMMLLRETGIIISYILRMTGLADQPVELLYNDGAVILGPCLWRASVHDRAVGECTGEPRSLGGRGWATILAAPGGRSFAASSSLMRCRASSRVRSSCSC